MTNLLTDARAPGRPTHIQSCLTWRRLGATTVSRKRQRTSTGPLESEGRPETGAQGLPPDPAFTGPWGS